MSGNHWSDWGHGRSSTGPICPSAEVVAETGGFTTDDAPTFGELARAYVAELMKEHAERLVRMVEATGECQKCHAAPVQVIARPAFFDVELIDEPMGLRITETVRLLCESCAAT